MAYRKFRADLLFTGEDMLDDGSVLITDKEGNIQEITSAEKAGEDVEYYEGLITPGFVNVHCHVELSHMIDLIPEGTGLVEFLVTVIKRRGFPQETIDEGISRAIRELSENGTVAVGDICNTSHTIAQKNKSSLHWHNFVEAIGFTEKPEDRFAFASNLLEIFLINAGLRASEQQAPVFNASLSPHAPYSVSDRLFQLINAASPELLTIHNQETAAENELYQSGGGELNFLYGALGIDPTFFRPSGKSSLQSYLPLLNRPSKILLVHNSFTSEEDLLFLKSLTSDTHQDIYMATCINANLYIENTVPPLELFMKHGLPICIGTDSYASNHSLNMLDEMKTIQQHFPSVTLHQLLRWSTMNGATALDMEKLTGSFEKGKRPGVVHVTDIFDGKLQGTSVSRRLL